MDALRVVHTWQEILADNCQSWRALACFDSIDSIAYYTDAQAGRAWLGAPGAE